MKSHEMFHQKISIAMILSGALFTLCWFLDYYITNASSGGNYTFEANAVARLWWQIMGATRFIEFPIWIGVIFITTLYINLKSNFLALLWLNFFAFQHLIGFVTWLPYGTFDFLYSLPDWASGYVISLISILIGLPLAFLETKLKLFRH